AQVQDQDCTYPQNPQYRQQGNQNPYPQVTTKSLLIAGRDFSLQKRKTGKSSCKDCLQTV
ncbi:MAG: hypothetical protein II310_06225, partial [Selenomonadaceae bacterium]|nr:hypothetical protein [Selenomonadaceae bacterium]